MMEPKLLRIIVFGFCSDHQKVKKISIRFDLKGREWKLKVSPGCSMTTLVLWPMASAREA